jgi:hypothetical protein
MFDESAENGTFPIMEFHDLRAEPGAGDELCGLLAERFGAGLERLGASSPGLFRVPRQPDRVIWLRSFADGPARQRILQAFHTSPEWTGSRSLMAELLRDDSVHLLRAVSALDSIGAPRRAPMAAVLSDLRFQEAIGNYHLWLRLFLRKAGMTPVASYATLEAENDVPAVAVRRHQTTHLALVPSRGPLPDLPPDLSRMLRWSPEFLVLEPALPAIAIAAE